MSGVVGLTLDVLLSCNYITDGWCGITGIL